jgi:hypothetical protein
MQFDKAQVIQMLMSQGKNDQAEQADRELPGQVDTDQHADLLSRIGIDPSSLLGGLGGGGAAGALGGLLGWRRQEERRRVRRPRRRVGQARPLSCSLWFGGRREAAPGLGGVLGLDGVSD